MRFLALIFAVIILWNVPVFAIDFKINDLDIEDTENIVEALSRIEALSRLKIETTGYFYYKHDASEGDGQSNSFDLARMYLGAKYMLSENFTLRYLSDISHQDKTGKFEVFAKYAYVDWKVNDKFSVIMGLQGTGNWKEPEKAWGYRSIQYAPMESFGKYWESYAGMYAYIIDLYARTPGLSSSERRKFMNRHENFLSASASKMGSSADMGITLKFKPVKNTYASFMVLNGTGYKKAETDMYKNFQLRAGTKMVDNRLHLSGYVEIEPWDGPDLDGATQLYMNMQWDLMASFKRNGIFSVGVDLNGKNYDGIETVNAMNYSIFGNFHVIQEKLKVLARYDYYSTGFDDVDLFDDKFNWESNASLIILGLDYIAHKNVHIIPNFQMLSPEKSDEDPFNTIYVHVSFKF